jgi:hypothetical protein
VTTAHSASQAGAPANGSATANTANTDNANPDNSNTAPEDRANNGIHARPIIRSPVNLWRNSVKISEKKSLEIKVHSPPRLSFTFDASAPGILVIYRRCGNVGNVARLSPTQPRDASPSHHLSSILSAPFSVLDQQGGGFDEVVGVFRFGGGFGQRLSVSVGFSDIKEKRGANNVSKRFAANSETETESPNSETETGSPNSVSITVTPSHETHHHNCQYLVSLSCLENRGKYMYNDDEECRIPSDEHARKKRRVESGNDDECAEGSTNSNSNGYSEQEEAWYLDQLLCACGFEPFGGVSAESKTKSNRSAGTKTDTNTNHPTKRLVRYTPVDTKPTSQKQDVKSQTEKNPGSSLKQDTKAFEPGLLLHRLLLHRPARFVTQYSLVKSTRVNGQTSAMVLGQRLQFFGTLLDQNAMFGIAGRGFKLKSLTYLLK